MTQPKIKCTAQTAQNEPCRAYAIKDSKPPRCSAHSGLLGARKGNSNAMTHGYYAQGFPKDEIAGLFTEAEDVTLSQEAILLRVVLKRLSSFLVDENLSVKEITSITPLIISAARALATLQKHLPDPNALDWDAALDQLSEEWGWDL